jgi:hypothetical protein
MDTSKRTSNMRLRIIGILGVVVLAAVSPGIAGAQIQQPFPDHLEASAGFGFGSSALTCDHCTGNRQTGPSGYLRVGRTFGPSLTLSAELNAWSKPIGWAVFRNTGDVLGEGQSGSRATIATLNLVAHWYTDDSRRFFLDGGLGVGRYQSHGAVPGDSNLSAHSQGLGYQAGVGYDARINTHLALTPFIKVFGLTMAKFGPDQVEMGANTTHLGLGLTWQ